MPIISKIEECYKILEKRAREGGTIEYGELYPAIGLRTEDEFDRRVGSFILTEVNVKSQKNGFQISAIAVSHTAQKPDRGFFSLAREWDLLGANEDENNFWETEKKKIYDFYSKN
jgi:hypothetical protein